MLVAILVLCQSGVMCRSRSPRGTNKERSLAADNSSRSPRGTNTERALAVDNNQVCLFMNTVLDDSLWTDNWRERFLHHMRTVLMESVYRQCTKKSPCRSLESFHFFVQTQDKSFSEIVPTADKDLWVNVHFNNRSENHTLLDRIVVETVSKNRCRWIAYTWLEADDAFMDGYFQYITTKVPKVLITTSRNDGSSWLGALFAARKIKTLVLGHNRCTTSYYYNDFYSGQSQGQGLILRRDIWLAIKSPYIHRGFHVHFLKKVRELVMRKLGYPEYSSPCCVHEHTTWENTKLQIQLEKEDASESGILFIDVTADWKTSALFVQTPFSSHFPHGNYSDLPICDKEQQHAIREEFPKDVMFLMHVAKEANMSFEEACYNNRFMRNKNVLCKRLTKDVDN